MSAADTGSTTAPAKRPLSPHLQIYRFQITMTMSILHRASGIALTVGTLLLAWWVVSAAIGGAAFDAVSWFLGSVLGILMLMGWSVALFYHLFAGVRHLLWDYGFGYDIPTMYRTGWTVVGTVAVVTLASWIVGFVVW
jgi:succinate dehydrogenase / fumarate reductase cytochrome b subunit